jgi:hypothetical protein
MKLNSLLYLQTLSEEDVQKHQCSDRLWLPYKIFERWMLHSDPGIVVLLQLTNGVGQRVIGNLYGVHYMDDTTIYVPSWMMNVLEYDHDHVELEQVHPHLCTELTLSPHTSDHLHVEDPLELLRDAFENYSCLIRGESYKLWLGDHMMEVTIVAAKPEESDTLCIRNCEIDLQLLPPLDIPIPLPPPPPTTLATATATATAIPVIPVEIPNPVELRRRMAEAARARLSKPTNAD